MSDQIDEGLTYLHHGYKKPYPIETVLRDLAAQEGCDGEPYDAMVFAAAAITALRAQLAEANARADRAEAERAAQIEVDAMAVSAWGTISLADMDDGVKWQFDLPDQIAASLRAQPHDRTALDRVKAEVRVAAIRESADKLKGQGYNTAVCQILALLDKDGA